MRASIEVRVGRVGDTLAKWLILRVEGDEFGWADRPYWCKRATGRNIKKLEAELPELLDLMRQDSRSIEVAGG